MLKLAANLDWLFCERPIAARFQAAKAAGFHGVEGLFLWQHPLDVLLTAQRETGLPVALMNAPAGNWQAGERGLASLPDRDEEFHRSLMIARDYATALGCRKVHVMAGLRADNLSACAQRERLTDRLRIACDVMVEAGIDVLIEPLNPEDMPGYFVDSFPLAESLINEVARKNIGLQFDIYHCQKIHGNVAHLIERYFSIIKHFQIASVPGRHEPGTGELNETWLFNFIKQTGYQGWMGCEYKPSTPGPESLRWMTPYL
ncbi:hydroxypyruvate isomerase family protein [Citrobacter farmeri]|uniref:hydroxypyruvate isomerase family protein n=1 Tax=Citrobacter farmeri TaxID=67824 RepID=UPI00189CD227|nr:TIM barrel protein [Citrobacter farmeri]EHK0947430.1 TIM barrel protein [Citrobacter farmeri]EKX4542991.1 TIM barrel protein [Citrobacter farmeri]MDB2165411.1 TIM barrel protein [Citrobacter farmeri]HBC0357315.1 TIM barrel protein [Citrobacter farmeri]HBZ8832470.1 TIM barrel protein [Citrobacter farmeri]